MSRSLLFQTKTAIMPTFPPSPPVPRRVVSLPFVSPCGSPPSLRAFAPPREAPLRALDCPGPFLLTCAIFAQVAEPSFFLLTSSFFLSVLLCLRPRFRHLLALPPAHPLLQFHPPATNYSTIPLFNFSTIQPFNFSPLLPWTPSTPPPVRA